MKMSPFCWGLMGRPGTDARFGQDSSSGPCGASGSQQAGFVDSLVQKYSPPIDWPLEGELESNHSPPRPAMGPGRHPGKP